MKREKCFLRHGKKMDRFRSRKRCVPARICFTLLGMVMSLFGILSLTSCEKKEETQKEVPFEICGETELPDELRELVEKKKEEPFRFTYENSAHLYLAVGYGKQPCGEYVVAVRQMYETETGIYVDTTLVSLSHVENWQAGEPSVYPYVVIRCEKSEKNVFFL